MPTRGNSDHGQILCLRLACPLADTTADALLAAVSARVREARPGLHAVVLELSGTPAVGAGVRSARLSLCDLPSQSHVGLRLVVLEAEARTALSSDGPIGLDARHGSVRAAVLAAHAARAGPAVVTRAMRTQLMQPPEWLLT